MADAATHGASLHNISNAPIPGYEAPSRSDSQDSEKKDEDVDPELAMAQQVSIRVESGKDKYKKLGWVKLTICLIVEAIALGSLSIPSAFAKVGMVAGVILCVGLGLAAIYTSYVIGQVKLKYPEIEHYTDAVKLIWGEFGYQLTSVMFIIQLILLLGSHSLTGTIAFVRIVDSATFCALVFSIISAVILFLLALPPSFSEFSVLGYIDFASIIIAIGICIIATGIESNGKDINWSAWPPPGMSFYEAFLATSNIILAYSFAVCQFSFMSEMYEPKDYVKSIWSLGLIEIVIYTVTGATIYAFVGQDVESPALLSSGFTVSRVAFGVALPVIFISGSINGVVAGRHIMERMFKNSKHPDLYYVTSFRAWCIWIPLIAVLTLIGWVIAEAVPFFNDLLGLISSLFISGFTFYFPALFWYYLIREGPWYKGWHNLSLSALNLLMFIIGVTLLGCGTYASVRDIVKQYQDGNVRGSFSCDASGYA